MIMPFGAIRTPEGMSRSTNCESTSTWRGREEFSKTRGACMRYTLGILAAFAVTVFSMAARAENDEEAYRFSGGEKISVKIQPPAAGEAADQVIRSEERRVGKECRSRW